ncbi:hypothetical protein EIK79_14900 [Halocatena pleomorpha]|uniref:Uncharacterized protein n=2 Tax=Halocatena pleomorpha TaxID=1785090 RepID=A0A3P3R5Z7_9EURY|nr:hypothetical protein EIK79_14900 [Halocatena pleomorpha]
MVKKYIKTERDIIVCCPNHLKTNTVSKYINYNKISNKYLIGPPSNRISPQFVEEINLFDWLPFRMVLHEEIGGEYIRDIESGWEWHFNSSFTFAMRFLMKSDEDYTRHHIATNRSEESIAVVIRHKEEDEGGVYLIPSKDNQTYSEFVRKTLGNVYGIDAGVGGRSPPEWLSECSLPGETNIEQTIAQHQTKIDDLKDELKTLEGYKNLLYEGDNQLERIVPKALRELGLTVGEEIPGKRDGIIETDETAFALEITGTTNEVGLDKARQLDNWVGNVLEEGDYESTDGLLIPNGSINDSPNDREDIVSSNAMKYIEQRGYKILTTVDIYQLIEHDLEHGMDAQMVEDILHQDQIFLTLPDYISHGG